MKLRLWTAVVALLAACGGPEGPGGPQGPETGLSPPATKDRPASSASTTPSARPPGSGDFATRQGEIVDPDALTMLLLYYDLANLAPPIDNWAQDDPRVTAAPPPDKPGIRDAIRAELEAATQAVADAGYLRLSIRTAVGYYDPTYGEFTIRALAPSSVIEFKTHYHKVGLRFGNGRVAQLWKVPEDEATAIGDRFGRTFNARLDSHLRIRSVQPGAHGGTIVADVLGYELRDHGTGALIARVDVPQQ